MGYDDAIGILLSKTYPDLQLELYGYDTMNRLTSKTQARQVDDRETPLSTTYVYDERSRRLVQVNYNDKMRIVYYNYRYYNTQDGRWINRDPIAEQGGVNLYAYVGNGVNWLGDELGLQGFGGPGCHFNSPTCGYSTQTNKMMGISCVTAATVPIAIATIATTTAGAVVVVTARMGIRTWMKQFVSKKVSKCLLIYNVYKAAAGPAEGCKKPCLTCRQYEKKLIARSFEVVGRAAYLKLKCDYILPGSIKKGSALKEASHRTELSHKITAFNTCTRIALKAGCLNLAKLPQLS